MLADAHADAVSSVALRPMTVADLPFATALHRRCLRHGLFPELGPRFLSAYLGTFLSSPFAVSLVAAGSDDFLGFLVGTLDDRAHYRHVIRRYGLRLCALGAVALLLRPGLAWHFARTRATRYLRGSVRLAREAGPVSARVADAVLSHVAVAANGRGQRVGAALVDEFVAHARLAGLPAVRLVTRADGDGAGGFYRRLGWQEVARFDDRDGLSWTRYRLVLQ